jgi:hypothetical protein
MMALTSMSKAKRGRVRGIGALGALVFGMVAGSLTFSPAPASADCVEFGPSPGNAIEVTWPVYARVPEPGPITVNPDCV